MASKSLAHELAVYVETFKACREYFLTTLKMSKETVLALEKGQEIVYVAYLFSFIEQFDIDTIQLLAYTRHVYDYDLKHSKVSRQSVILGFSMIEKGKVDLNIF